MALSGLLAEAHSALAPLMQEAGAAAQGGPAGRIVLFFSLSDGRERARVCHQVAMDFATAWTYGVERTRKLANHHKMDVRWLRVDWVTSAQATTWAALKARLARNKRNYFRHGLALGTDFAHAFLEQELNANAMLYGGVRTPVAQLNERNFARYASIRYGDAPVLDFSDDAPVIVFSTQGLFVARDASLPGLPGGPSPWRLNGAGRNAGRRSIPRLQPDDVKALVACGSAFLARQVRENGKFVYGYFPCFGRNIRTYNTLRHASTIYAMLEAWELTQDAALFDAIRRSLHYLTHTIIRRYPQADGTTLAFNVDINDEIKLGANAVSILALVKYTELTQDDRYLPLMAELAQGIIYMQCPDTGKFDHVLNADDLSVKQAFRIIYYDGEAAFGLMRLYGLTRDARWLLAVEQAFDYFIEAEHWKAHDHWLSYCANELTLYKPEEKYFRFGVQNIADHLDFIHRRLTTYPTLLELSMAFHQMLERLKQHPDMQHVLDGLNIDRFYQALHHRAHYLLNGFFWPEMAMYFARPDTIVGSFFIRHHSFRVRIDDVEHYLSGLVAYWKMLAGQSAAVRHVPATRPLLAHQDVSRSTALFAPLRKPFVANWTAEALGRAAGGRWQPAPERPGWRATGVSFAISAQQAGHAIMVRLDDSPASGALGVPLAAVHQLPFMPEALLAEPAAARAIKAHYPGPVLVVDSLALALEGLAKTARAHMAGPVIGVTGSAGKTTACAMLAHVLRAWGSVGSSRLSANTFRGLAWNMASMPWNSDYFVLEMAIAGMTRTTQLARPQLAVVTNIGPAHLQYHGDTATIARRKAALLEGMAAGSAAIINSDMAHADVFLEAARHHGLRTIRFSQQQRRSDADIVADSPDYAAGSVRIHIADETHALQMPGLTPHMLDNVLAIVGVVHALGLNIHHAMYQIGTFRPLPGRGARLSFSLDGKRVRLIDESYNANPLSMQAALQSFPQFSRPGQGVLLLGDMMELDSQAASLHQALVPHIVAAQPRRVSLVGEHMAALVPGLDGQIPARSFASPRQAWQDIVGDLADNEVVLVKGSHSIGLYRLIRELSAQYGVN